MAQQSNPGKFRLQWLPCFYLYDSATHRCTHCTKALELGCDALMEGSTGKGNDQYRMHNVFSLFAPGMPIFVPVRDFDLTRGEEQLLMEYYRRRGRGS